MDGWSTPRPGRSNHEKDTVPLYRRLGGPQSQSGRVRKNSFPPGFDPRTVQPVTILCTDGAIPVPSVKSTVHINSEQKGKFFILEFLCH